MATYKTRYELFAFCLALICFALSCDIANADEYDDFVKVECLPELNKFSASFFYVNRGFVKPGANAESLLKRREEIEGELSGKGLHILPFDKDTTANVTCILPGFQFGGEKVIDRNIEFRAFYNPNHKSCNRELPNVDYQLYLDGKLVAEDTFDRNCAFVQGVQHTNIYELSVINYMTPILEMCGYMSQKEHICEKYKAQHQTQPYGIVRSRWPHIKNWLSEKLEAIE